MELEVSLYRGLPLLRSKTTSEEPRSLSRHASTTINTSRRSAPMPPPTRDRTALLDLPWDPGDGACACSWDGGASACCSWGGGAPACFGGGEAISPVCAWGGGGRGTSASGVGTWAVSCAGLPQFGQNCSSSRSCCPQLLQYLSTMVILPLLPCEPRAFFVAAPALPAPPCEGSGPGVGTARRGS